MARTSEWKNVHLAVEAGAELPFGELPDGHSELKAQVVERAQLSAQILRYITVLQA